MRWLLLAVLVVTSSASASQVPPTTWGFASPPSQFDYLEVNNRIRAGNSSTAPEEFRAMLEFDLSATPPAALPAQIYLNLQTDQTAGALSFQLYGYIADGVVDRSDFFAGDVLLSEFLLSTPAVLSFDVTSFVRGNFDTGSKLLGFNLRPTVPGGFPKDTTWSFINVGLGEQTPEPATLSLIGLAMVSGLGLRRRRA